MTGNFRTVKKKFLITAAVVSAVAGICLGLLAAGAMLVGFKLSLVELDWWIYLLAGLGVAVVGGACVFVIMYPYDNRVAKKLDRDYALGQKVQTMVEFSAVEQPDQMVLMQRNQADEALGEVAKKRIKLGWLWKFAFIPVLAAAMFVGGIVTPLNKTETVTPPPVTEPPVDITAAQKLDLENLIRDVEGSALTEDVKTPSLASLNALLAKLDEEMTQSELKTEVVSTARAVDGYVAQDNDYLEMSSAIKEEPLLEKLAEALVDATSFYKEGGATIVSMTTVDGMHTQAPQEVRNVLTAWQSEFMAQYDKATSIAEVKNSVWTYANTFYNVLVEENENAPAMGESVLNDAMLSNISNLISYSGPSSSEAGLSLNAYISGLSQIMTTFTNTVTGELCIQSYSCIMDEYIRNRLAQIFGLTVADLGSNEEVIPGGSEDLPGSNTGGYGDNETEYGSDDLVLDPNTLEMVPYGELIDRYNAIIQERITSGDTPEELVRYILSYFDALYGGLEEEEE